ncbi:MAG: FAD-dependent thymidylate synthase [Candidatus Celaenobacter polaris]|nr:FAD-dependent thymidylate synthase [Candidatus Celaenobacter polaris]
MRVILAGYNVDISQLPSNKVQCTPETFSAAYARISRSKKSVDELRKDAVLDIEKARRSNQTIVFEMGHSSIAEHAVFNFDIIGISRYLTEFVQRTRLASFTEKSQRYVTLDGDYVIPEEIQNDAEILKHYQETIQLQNDNYISLFEKLKSYFIRTTSLSKKDIEGQAKEDARYVLSMATETQMGMTLNARSMEHLLKRLYALPLNEAKNLADSLYEQVRNIAPSLIRYIEPSKYDTQKYKTDVFAEFNKPIEKCNLISHSAQADERIIAGLLFRSTGTDYQTVFEDVKRMNKQDKEQIIQRYLSDITCYDSLPREFELVDLVFQANISSSCFAQLKRHRIATIISTDYDPKFGYTMPKSIDKIAQKDAFRNVMKKSEKMYEILSEKYPEVKNYILTNAHHKVVLFKCNMRELCHFARLRQDAHAQWDIRELAQDIIEKAKEVAPITSVLICGKDVFPDVNNALFK